MSEFYKDSQCSCHEWGNKLHQAAIVYFCCKIGILIWGSMGTDSLSEPASSGYSVFGACVLASFFSPGARGLIPLSGTTILMTTCSV